MKKWLLTVAVFIALLAFGTTSFAQEMMNKEVNPTQESSKPVKKAKKAKKAKKDMLKKNKTHKKDKKSEPVKK